MAEPTRYSKSTEDYLKVIYKLETAGGGAQTSAIAEALDIAPPSVSGMVKRLSETGLLEHAPYRGVRLTVEGKRTALKMLRRHRIIETYLIEELNYAWDDVHDEAERLEHAVSDRLIEAMARALEDPHYDPHGAPIPTANGEVEVPDLIPMTEVPVGSVGELRMVSDKDPERLRFLASLGLKPGIRFTVVERQPFHGPVTLRLAGEDGGSAVVGYELAYSLQCVEAGSR